MQVEIQNPAVTYLLIGIK